MSACGGHESRKSHGRLFFPVSFLAGALCLGASCDVPAQATAAAANTVTRAAAQQGVQSCLGRIQQITSALGYSPQSGAMLMLPPSDPDQRMIPLAMELPTGKDAAFVGVDFAPNQANGCGASYDAVVYWKQPCKTVASKNFSRLKPIGTLKKNVRILDGGLNVKVFLLPAGTGCVSIKKEVVL